MKLMDKQQAKQIKCMLGLNPYQTKTTPLLQALGISLISESTNIHSLDSVFLVNLTQNDFSVI